MHQRLQPLYTSGGTPIRVQVKPVVSDFDTFTVGCRGIRHEPTPPEQVELIHWALDHTAELLKQDNTKGWTGHWLDVLKVRVSHPVTQSLRQ